MDAEDDPRAPLQDEHPRLDGIEPIEHQEFDKIEGDKAAGEKAQAEKNGSAG